MWFYRTPPLQMIFGLREALDMILEEGLPGVFARHARLALATRRAVACWATAGAMEFQVIPPEARSDTVTCIRFAQGQEPDALRQLCRERLSVAFGGGLGRLQGRALRIGHLGDLNEPMILGALGALEAGLAIRGIPHGPGALAAAAACLAERRRAGGAGQRAGTLTARFGYSRRARRRACGWSSNPWPSAPPPHSGCAARRPSARSRHNRAACPSARPCRRCR